MSKIYLVGSLRHGRVREVAHELREAGHDVFDDWHACGPDADTAWQSYETERGRTFKEALQAPFAQHCFVFDMKHIMAADIGIIVLPAGKSAHLEIGFMRGHGKRSYILMDGEPDRWDLMYMLANDIFYSVKELLEVL